MIKMKTVSLLIMLFISVNSILGAQVLSEDVKDQAGYDKLQEKLSNPGISDDTVIAEFGDKSLLFADLKKRLEKIPSMYKRRYTTLEGKNELLDMMVTEELFVLAAYAEGIDQDPQLQQRIAEQLKPYYAQLYKKELEKDFELSDDIMHAHYLENLDKYPGQTFEEAKPKLRNELYKNNLEAFIQQQTSEKIAEYEMEINSEILAEIDPETLQYNEELAEQNVIRANQPELTMSTADFMHYSQDLKNQGRLRLQDQEELKTFAENVLSANLQNYLALEMGLDQRPEVIEEVAQIERGLLLRTVYNRKIVEQIDTSEDAAKDYYEENIEQFSSRASRQIQQFVFADKKRAGKMRKQVIKLHKKDKTDQINELVRENSTKPGRDGVLSHIYKNDIIPGIGKDEKYSEMVWKQNPDKVSKVFQNSKDDFVFFRVLEDNVAEAEPFAEIVDKVRAKMQRELAKEKFETMKQQLAEEYSLKTYPDKMVVKLTAKEYFDNAEIAQKSKRYDDAIYYYDQVIKFYPNTKDDYKAIFMKAFLLAEELNDNEQALQLFEKLLDEYEEDELHDSARFMVNEISGEGPSIIDFED
ncbi:MAG: peptidyl-prolyl cis-trans isomerase [Candidatus Cloacimonadales bacterium]